MFSFVLIYFCRFVFWVGGCKCYFVLFVRDREKEKRNWELLKVFFFFDSNFWFGGGICLVWLYELLGVFVCKVYFFGFCSNWRRRGGIGVKGLKWVWLRGGMRGVREEEIGFGFWNWLFFVSFKKEKKGCLYCRVVLLNFCFVGVFYKFRIIYFFY